jgi:mannose-6-phosphate isomerase-like protein (cupin superfamily)
MHVRRVVTGHDAADKAVFASDQQVAPVTVGLLPGAEFHRLWGADETPTFPDDGAQPTGPAYFPSVDGFRFGFFTLPPAGTQTLGDVDLDAAITQVEADLPGLISHMEPDNPGMHTTDTIDFEVVLSGEVVLELDDGAEKLLGPGDTVVQNGTRHRWDNRGTQPVVIAVFMVGAHRR